MAPPRPRTPPGFLDAKASATPTGSRGRRPFGAIGRVADVKKKLRLCVPDGVNQSKPLGDSSPRGSRHSLGRGTQSSKPVSRSVAGPILLGDLTREDGGLRKVSLDLPDNGDPREKKARGPPPKVARGGGQRKAER